MNLAQQILYILKRLTEKKSEYSAKKMEEDYKRCKIIKKLCVISLVLISKKQKEKFSSHSKFRQSERNEFLPTINYINDGYLDKFGQKVKSAKNKNKNTKEKIPGKKLFCNVINENNDKKENKKINDKDKVKDKHQLNEDENEKIINVSRNENEIDNKDDENNL